MAGRVWRFVFRKNIARRLPIMIMVKVRAITNKDEAVTSSANAAQAEDCAEQLAVKR